MNTYIFLKALKVYFYITALWKSIWVLLKTNHLLYVPVLHIIVITYYNYCTSNILMWLMHWKGKPKIDCFVHTYVDFVGVLHIHMRYTFIHLSIVNSIQFMKLNIIILYNSKINDNLKWPNCVCSRCSYRLDKTTNFIELYREFNC